MPTDNISVDDLVSIPEAPESPSHATLDERKRLATKTTDDNQRAKTARKSLQLANLKIATEIGDHKSRIGRAEKDHVIMWSFRRWFGAIGFAIVATWQFTIFSIVLLHGFGRICLSDAVMVALLTTTTANVVGLLVIVMKFVFAPVQTLLKGTDPS